MGIASRHFPDFETDSNVLSYDIPGVSGKVYKRLNPRGRVFTQEGLCTSDLATRNSVLAGEGNPTVLTDVDAGRFGVITNCWKRKVTFQPRGKTQPVSGDRFIWYRILYETAVGGS